MEAGVSHEDAHAVVAALRNHGYVLKFKSSIKTDVSSVQCLDHPDVRDELQLRFPSVDVDYHIEEAKDWLLSKGRRQKDYVAFMRNWLRKVTNGFQGKAKVDEGMVDRMATHFVQVFNQYADAFQLARITRSNAIDILIRQLLGVVDTAKFAEAHITLIVKYLFHQWGNNPKMVAMLRPSVILSVRDDAFRIRLMEASYYFKNLKNAGPL